MKASDLVMIKEDKRFDDSGLLGIVQWINEDCCGILMEGGIEVYARKYVKVVSRAE